MPLPTSDSITAPAQSSGSPRVAIVIGGSRGIGRGTVGRLAGDGYAVAAGYLVTGASSGLGAVPCVLWPRRIHRVRGHPPDRDSQRHRGGRHQRPTGRGGAQRRAYGPRRRRGVHRRAVGRPVRRECSGHPARQPRRPAEGACPGLRAPDADRQLCRVRLSRAPTLRQRRSPRRHRLCGGLRPASPPLIGDVGQRPAALIPSHADGAEGAEACARLSR